MKTKIFAILISALALSACSTQAPDDSYVLSSNGNGQDNNVDPDPTPTPGAAPAVCNQFTSSSGQIAGKVRAAVNSWGVVDSSYVRVRFSSVPSKFANSESVYIEFFLWGVSPSGSIIEASSPWRPLQFRLENPSTGAAACPTSGTSGCYFGWSSSTSTNIGFNKAALNNISGTTDVSKLTQYNFVVTGTATQYQVLRVQLTDTANSANTEFVDFLLPVYEANPNVYATTHAATLNSMHPLWPRRSEGWSSTDFLGFTNQYCF